jgi:hypothetical protein
LTEPVFANAEEAAQALASAVQEDAAGRVAPEPTVTPDPEPNQPVTPDATGSPELAESFTDFNAALDGLPDEARALVEQRLNQMQGDYTRKTQEAAEQRREAEQAIQFVQELETNPNFALQVHNEIAQALESVGFSTEEADEEAARQVLNAVSENEGAGDPDSDDPIVRELNELKAWRAEQEARQLQFEMENEFDRMDVEVRQANPDFSEDDWSHVYALAYATGGDLEAAAGAYKQETERIIQNYIEKKTGVTTPANPTIGTSAQLPPEKFDGLLDPRLEAAATRMLEEGYGQ